MISTLSPFATPIEHLAAYFEPFRPRARFQDAEIDEIAHLLQQCSHTASMCPRTYILFRTIGHLEVVERLVGEGFTDAWFPVEHRGLPSFLAPNVKSAVVHNQDIVLTKSLDLENGRHGHFAPGEQLPFDILSQLGSGGHGQVDRISSKLSFRQYALKRVRRKAAFGNASSREALKAFVREINILRSLTHKHMVQYIGSYSDRRYLGLIMSPVADSDLAVYLERLCSSLQSHHGSEILPPMSQYTQRMLPDIMSNLRTFFGCLASALAYLHSQNVRHKDIKPQNILVLRGDVLLTDFGLSRNFTDDVGSTSTGMTPASPRYCAPEVAAFEPRNTSSDIWSLGCVFLEMVSALQGFSTDSIRLLFATGSTAGLHYHNNPSATQRLIEKLRSKAVKSDRRPLLWIADMLFVDRTKRPTAAHVLEMITTPETENDSPSTFCGICCVPDLATDSSDSLDEDAESVTTNDYANHQGIPISERQAKKLMSRDMNGHRTYDSNLDNVLQIAPRVETHQTWAVGSSRMTRIEDGAASTLPQGSVEAPSNPPLDTPENNTQLRQQDAIDLSKRTESDASSTHTNEQRFNHTTVRIGAQPDKAEEASRANHNQQLQSRRARPGQNNRKSVTTSAASTKKKTIDHLDTLVVDTLGAFKDFAREERLRMMQWRKDTASEAKMAELNGFKEFAAKFKVSTPVPLDLIHLLSNDKNQQAVIWERSCKQAANDQLPVSLPQTHSGMHRCRSAQW